MDHLLHFRGAPFSVCLACSAGGPLQDLRSRTLLFLPVELLRNFPWKFSCSVMPDSLRPTGCGVPVFLVLHCLLEFARTCDVH